MNDKATMPPADAGRLDPGVGRPVPERAIEDPADPSVHEPAGCKTPTGCSEHGCRGDCLDEDPACDRCGAPITTAMMPMICPHGRQCGFVEDDEHWQQVEALRVELGVKRVKPPNPKLSCTAAGRVSSSDG